MIITGGRGRIRGGIVVLVAAVLVALAAPPAWSHSELDRSDPPNGGMVAPGRTTLRLWYGEPVNLDASRFDLRTLDGSQVSALLSPPLPGDDTVRLETDPLPLGTYELSWRVLSLTDGHSSSGTLVFGSGLRPNVVPAAGGGLPPVPVLLLRWLDLTALLVAIGALAVSGRVLDSLGQLGRRPRRLARTVGLVSVVASVYAGLITPFIRTQRSGTPYATWLGDTWATLTETPWGHLWIAREVAVLLAAGAMWSWARGSRGGVLRTRFALASLALAALLESLAGHAASLPRAAGLAAVVSATHVVAAGVWAGGLIVLVVCLVPLMRRTPEVRGVVLSSVWRTFSPMAAIASIVLLATGLYEAGRHVPSIRVLTSTAYGGAVAGKTVLVVVALVLAGTNLLLVNPGVAGEVGRILRRPPGWRPVSAGRFTRVVTIEAGTLLVAVALAALLTSAPTSREVADANRVTAPHSENIDGLFISFEQAPAGPARSQLLARVRSTILPPPHRLLGVDVALVGPSGRERTVSLEQVEEGRFEAETSVATPGRWTAAVQVHRQGVPDTISRAGWTVRPPGETRVTRLEIATDLAAVLLLGLVGLLAVRLVRRRRVETLSSADSPAPEKEASLR